MRGLGVVPAGPWWAYWRIGSYWSVGLAAIESPGSGVFQVEVDRRDGTAHRLSRSGPDTGGLAYILAEYFVGVLVAIAILVYSVRSAQKKLNSEW